MEYEVPKDADSGTFSVPAKSGRLYGSDMIDAIAQYLEQEFECEVTVAPVMAADTGRELGDQCLAFTFHGTAHTVLVTAAALQQPPADLQSFFEDDEASLADVIMLAEGQTVLVQPNGFRIADP